MALRILHVLDHSIPLHSGYTFRTLSILREQRRLGWETFHLTSPKQLGCDAEEEVVDGLKFYRTTGSPLVRQGMPGLSEIALMRQLEQRLQQVAEQVRPHLLHAHSPVLNAIPALRVGKRLDIPVVYEVRAFWEDAAVDHGTTTEGSLRYRLSRRLETRSISIGSGSIVDGVSMAAACWRLVGGRLELSRLSQSRWGRGSPTSSCTSAQKRGPWLASRRWAHSCATT